MKRALPETTKPGMAVLDTEADLMIRFKTSGASSSADFDWPKLAEVKKTAMQLQRV